MPQATLGQHRPSDARANIAAFAILAGTILRKIVLTTLVVSAGCGGGSDDQEERYWNCLYRGGPGAWKHTCEVVPKSQCNMSEPCDGSDTRNCEPGRTTCIPCNLGGVQIC